MFYLGKKLSSVLLCGSMAVTLLGNSGVHAANELTEAVEDEFEEKVTTVDEYDDKVENDDKGNENTELDTDKEYQYVAKEDVPAQNPAKRSGSSFAVDVAKGLSTAALGVGMGVGADEGVRRFKRDSSGNEAGGQAPIASKDGTENEVPESQVSELLKKLEEGEKIYLDNLEYGAIGVTGWIPQLRDKVSSRLGRNFDVKSKAAIAGVIISHAIGLALFIWNVFKVIKRGTRPKSITGWTYTAFEMLADFSLPPLALILQCVELIFNGLSSLVSSKNTAKDLEENKEADGTELKEVLLNNSDNSFKENYEQYLPPSLEGIGKMDANALRLGLRNNNIIDKNKIVDIDKEVVEKNDDDVPKENKDNNFQNTFDQQSNVN